MINDFDKLLSWFRYLFWSDLLYQRFVQHDEATYTNSSVAESLSFALSSQWLATMYVVIEGWKEASLSDPIIDELLNVYPDYVDLLRRFRNGVFHFQSKMFDKRLSEFVQNGSETLLWAFSLFYEFKRFYWLYPEQAFKHRDHRREFRITLHKMIGWLPTDILHAKVQELEELGIAALSKLQDADDFESASARELIASIEQLDEVARSIDCSPLLPQLPRLASAQSKH